MKIKLDENLPARLIEGLAELGHDVDSVPLERSLDNRTRKFGAHRRRPNGFLITQDLDFSDVRQFAPGTHKGILLVRLANPSRQRLPGKIRVERPSRHKASSGSARAIQPRNQRYEDSYACAA
jgi:predicted nuclease of predicted toxin-antitoxin system